MSLDAHWDRRTWLSVALLPLAGLFAVLAAARRGAFRRGLLPTYRAPVPVVVVGNLTVGGTGKTPLVIYFAEVLSRAGRRPGIVSRGYGGREPGPRRVEAGADPAEVGDEAALLARRCDCPVWIARRRPAAVAALLENDRCEVILCDDGLQHYALARDVEVVVLDAVRPFGNGWLLPAGPLRETPARLANVDLVVRNGGEVERGLAFGTRIAEACHLRSGRSRSLREFRGRRVHAVAGIGNPGRFFEALRGHGLDVVAHPFADHHAFCAHEVRFGPGEPVLMTEKDAVKCAAFDNAELWSVPLELHDPGERLAGALLDKLPPRSVT